MPNIRIADGKGRITLPAGFENVPVIIEKLTENEIRVRKAKVTALDDLPPSQQNGSADLSEPAKKRPGVIASIIDFLESASEEAPITKEELLDKLCQRFPERGRKGMANTCQTQLHNALRRSGVNLRSSESGYWIEK